MVELPNILLIGGTGQNCGKTSFACSLIKQTSRLYTVIAIKSSPHFTNGSLKTEYYFRSEHCSLIREYELSTGKDTARMLEAGAAEVYFLNSEKGYENLAIEAIMKLAGRNLPIIAEAGTLIHLIKPGLFVVMNSDINTEIKPQGIEYLNLANKVISWNGNADSLPVRDFIFSNNRWSLQTLH